MALPLTSFTNLSDSFVDHGEATADDQAADGQLTFLRYGHPGIGNVQEIDKDHVTKTVSIQIL